MKPNSVFARMLSGGSVPVRNELDAKLEQALIAARPQFEAPGGLRQDIMRQVRVCSRRADCAQPAAWLSVLRWAAVPAAACVLILALVMNRRDGTGVPLESARAAPVSLDAASQALATQERIPARFTSAMVGPLQEELRRVDMDLKRAAEYVMASVP